MDKDNEYYNPSLEEFHVGFVYESHTTSMNDLAIWNKGIFSGNEFDTWNSTFHFKTVLDDNRIRVKYLNAEDIESEGWISTEYEWAYDDYFLMFGKHFHLWKKDIQHCTFYIEHLDELDGHGQNKYIISIENHSTQTMKIVQIFNGNVKNISELRKLQKQLGINELLT